jgi:hypothetical protein
MNKNLKGKLNPNYIHGETLKKHYCKDCGKEICLQTALYGQGRCRKCAIIKHNPNYNDGRSLKEYYCICGNEIDYRTYFYGNKQCQECYLKTLKLENHPNWKGGLSFEEYGHNFDSSLKEQIRFRDHYKCRYCECSQLENGKQLDVHHIDYNKQNCENMNLISLCVKCHRKTNGNRDFWFAYFSSLMLSCSSL